MQGLTQLKRLSNYFRENHLGIAPDPPESWNLAPVDSSLFEHVNRALDRAEFPSEEALFAAIQSVLSHLTGDN
jgi:hypothetical protein